MQISALNMIIAAQQARQAAAPGAATSKALEPKPTAPADAQEFVPFAAGAQETSTPRTAAARPPNAPVGSQIDIRI
jgi:hypothetical protein